MKKAVRMFTFVVVLAVALGVTAFALEDSARENFKWSNYSGTCILTAEPKSVSASMTVTVDSIGTTYFGATFEMNGKATFIHPEGYGLRVTQPLDASGVLPNTIGASDSIRKTAAYCNYPSIMARCEYSIPVVQTLLSGSLELNV